MKDHYDQIKVITFRIRTTRALALDHGSKSADHRRRTCAPCKSAELNLAIDKARENLATLGNSVMPTGLTNAVAETGDLAKAWGDVAKNAAVAQRAIGQASSPQVITRLGPSGSRKGHQRFGR